MSKSKLAEHSWVFRHRFYFIFCLERISSKRKLKETFHIKSFGAISQSSLNLSEIWKFILFIHSQTSKQQSPSYKRPDVIQDPLIRSGHKAEAPYKLWTKRSLFTFSSPVRFFQSNLKRLLSFPGICSNALMTTIRSNIVN